MKLVAIIENVNQKINKNLIGDIVIVDSEYVISCDNELCYQELEHDRYVSFYSVETYLQGLLKLKHSVSNISIIGVL